MLVDGRPLLLIACLSSCDAATPPIAHASTPLAPAAVTPTNDPSLAPPVEPIPAASTPEDKPDAPSHTGSEPAPSTLIDANTLTALNDEQRATLQAGPEDAPIAVDTHYIQSNETAHHLYFPYIDSIGGAYIGVGSDQNYTLASKSRASLMFLMDIDTRVVDLHHMYRCIIAETPSGEEMVERWAPDSVSSTSDLLESCLADADPARMKRILRGFRNGRETVYRHLKRVIRRQRGDANVTWLNDRDMYSHIRNLYRTHRVRIMVGNLAGDTSLRTAATAIKNLDERLGTLYLSNAEEYFRYTNDFRTNIKALSGNTDAVVLRTIYSKKWVHADLWAYQVQPLADFQERLLDRENRSRNPMLRLASAAGELERDVEAEGFSKVGYPAQ